MLAFTCRAMVKSLDSFDFKAIPSLNKMMVLELARCEWIDRLSIPEKKGAIRRSKSGPFEVPRLVACAPHEANA